VPQPLRHRVPQLSGMFESKEKATGRCSKIQNMKLQNRIICLGLGAFK
jgi:hypothetical protein